jgi:DNA-binding NarL/FixJ family response regulator
MDTKIDIAAGPMVKKILLVDDHPVMREGLAQWISRSGDLQVCGEAENAAVALRLVAEVKPDLVLMDVAMPGRNGIELLKDLRTQEPELLVLVLSMHEEELYASRALRAGARGFVMKSAGGERILQAIRDALRGRIVVSPRVATLLLENYAAGDARLARSPLPQLTDREFEVFQLLGQARSNREIACHLHISPKTVETHRLNLVRKLKVNTAAELMRLALQYVDGGVGGPIGTCGAP